MTKFVGLSLGLVFGTWQPRSEQLEPTSPATSFSVAFNIGPPAPTSEQLEGDLIHGRGFSFSVGRDDDRLCVAPVVPAWPSFARSSATTDKRYPTEGRIIWSKRVGM